jgi:hypothetical protein
MRPERGTPDARRFPSFLTLALCPSVYLYHPSLHKINFTNCPYYLLLQRRFFDMKMPKVPQVHAEQRHHVTQATLGLIRDPNSGMLSTAKENCIQTIPVYNDGSSRETSPTTDSSYISAPSSVSSLNSFIQSSARSAYNHELMEGYKGYGSHE